MNQMPDITELDELLYRIDAEMGAAEAHGALCGMLCARGSIELSEWVDRVIAEQDQGSALLHDVVHKLSELHQSTLVAMNDAGGGFEMLLLDDDDPLPDRVEALATWCRGFSYGLAEGGIRQDSDLSDEIRELMHDLVEISRAGHEIDDSVEEDSDAGDDEVAYMEVVEYVRMGVMFIYEELQPVQATQTIH